MPPARAAPRQRPASDRGAGAGRRRRWPLRCPAPTGPGAPPDPRSPRPRPRARPASRRAAPSGRRRLERASPPSVRTAEYPLWRGRARPGRDPRRRCWRGPRDPPLTAIGSRAAPRPRPPGRQHARRHQPASPILLAIESSPSTPTGFPPRRDTIQRPAFSRHEGGAMPRAYAITAEAIAKESQRVGGDLEKFDVSKVIALDEVELRELGPRDVHLRILVVSAEHNVDHAALADTMNIAEFRGGQDLPRQQRRRRGARRRARRHALQARRRRHHPRQRRARRLRLSPAHLGLRPSPTPSAWYGEEADGRRLAAAAGAPRMRPEPVGDRRAAAARPHRLSPLAPRPRDLPRQGCARAARAPQRPRLRRRRVGAVPDARPPRGAPRDLLLRQPGAALAPRGPGHRDHRPEALQPLRGSRRRQGVQQAREEADRRGGRPPGVRHAARTGLRGRGRG